MSPSANATSALGTWFVLQGSFNEPQFAIRMVLSLTEPRTPLQLRLALRCEPPLVELLKRLGPQSGRGNLAWLAKHLVDLAGVQLFGVNHLPRVFLEHNRRPLHG